MRNSHEVEGVENGIIVVGVGEDQLVLELGLQEVCELLRAILNVVGVPHVQPVDDVEAGVRAIRVLEVVVYLVPAGRLVGEEDALRLPARVVVQGLEDDAVDIHVIGGDLTVNVAIVVLGDV